MNGTDAVGRVLALAATDPGFRRRARVDLGCALAEEGFVLDDRSMRAVREHFDAIRPLSDRAAYERIRSLAHPYLHPVTEG